VNRFGIKRAFRFPFRRRADIRAELREEFQFHLDMRQAELVASGLDESAARAQALREFGDPAAGEAACARLDWDVERRHRLAQWTEDLARDARLGWRLLWRSPGLSLVAIVTLSLGIGANAAIFSMFEQTLMRPLPVPAPGEVVNLSAPGPKPGGDNCNQAGSCDDVFSFPMFKDLEQAASGAMAMAAHRAMDITIAPPHRSSTWAMATLVSGSYFPVLRLAPAVGRLIDPGDAATIGGADVGVLSYDGWQSLFGADPGIVGQRVLINGRGITIVGVAPQGFAGTTLGIRPAVFLPLTLHDLMQPGDADLTNRRFHFVYAFARLRPGVSIERAREAVNVPYSRILNDVEAPLQVGASEQLMARFRSKQVSVRDGSRGQSRLHTALSTPFALLLLVTGIVLLIACANIANLLLVRSAGRSGEMAIRLSVGGGR
jgi:hypothetical protein